MIDPILGDSLDDNLQLKNLFLIKNPVHLCDFFQSCVNGGKNSKQKWDKNELKDDQEFDFVVTVILVLGCCRPPEVYINAFLLGGFKSLSRE